jgi:radical SAM superfamily enzyme YgiQ (UPF0313 family)
MKVLLVTMPASPEPINWPPSLLSVGCLAAYARVHPLLQPRPVVEVVSFVIGQPGKDDHDDEEILQVILLHKPDVVGFSCYMWNLERIRHVTQALHTIAPHVTIVWGGPEVGFTPEETLTAHSGVDIVVRGEGEETFVELLAALAAGTNQLDRVAGIAYREHGRVRLTAPRAPIANLDAIPSPYLSGVVDLPAGRRRPHVALESYRECPRRCGFCVSPGTPRYFSTDRVERELAFCFEHDIESLMFVDPYINIRRDWLLAIADALERLDSKQDKMAACFVMADRVDRVTVDALRRMNVPLAKTGLQTTNPDALRHINLPFDRERFRRAIRLLEDGGIHVHLQLIAGLPGDTLDGLRRTFEYVFELAPTHVTCFTPLLLPGSGLYQRREALAIRFDPRPPHRIFSHYSLTYDAMLECLEFGLSVCQEYNSLSRAQRRGVSLDENAFEPRDPQPRLRRFFAG